MQEAALFRSHGVVFKEYEANIEKKLEVAKKMEKEYYELKAKGFA